MPVRHRIDSAGGVILLELWGSVTGPEIFAYYDALLDDPALRPGLVVLADCRRVTSGPSFTELHSLANAKARLPEHVRPTRAAVLVNNGWLSGIVRQFAALIDRLGISVLPFADESDARRWLMISDDARATAPSANAIAPFEPNRRGRTTDAA